MSAALAIEPVHTDANKRPVSSSYNISIGYLRAFITLLVLGHHAVLAYHPFAPPAPASLVAEPRWWAAFPVVDAQRSTVFALFAGFNDIFFMALMFFLSGLFLWPSLQRKGAGHFLRDRALRLGVPFMVAAALVAPLAYYATYVQAGAKDGFWHEWMSLGYWPSGPAWFVWVLLAFDVMAAALVLALPNWGDRISKIATGAEQRPGRFFLMLVGLSVLAYVPLELAFNALRWSTFGPFTFQTSRILNYLLYFLLGAGVGACGLKGGLLAQSGKLARRWVRWSVGALVSFAVATGTGIAAISAHPGVRSWEIASDLTFVVSCAASSFAFMAVFVRFANSRGKIFDSLTANAYGMYLIHYMFVSWLQLSLLKVNLPAIVKGSVVTLATILLSWGVTAMLRKIPVVARII